jgi:hypothetical protein
VKNFAPDGNGNVTHGRRQNTNAKDRKADQKQNPSINKKFYELVHIF